MPSPPIDQVVTLSGDEDVRAKLAAIGVTAETAFTAAEESAVKAGISINLLQDISTKVGVAFNAVQKSFQPAVQAFKELQTAVAPVITSVEQLGSKFGLVFGGGVLAVVGGIGAIVKSSAEAAHALEIMNQQFGVSPDLIQKFADATAVAGGNSDKLSQLLSRLSVTLDKETQTATEAGANILKALFPNQVLGGQPTVIGQAATQSKLLVVSLKGIAEAVNGAMPLIMKMLNENDPGTVHNFEQVRNQIIQVASGSDKAAEAMRKWINEISAIKAPAQTLTEALDLNSEKGQQFLSRLGIQLTDATGNFKNLDQILPEVAEKLAAMPNGFQKAAIAVLGFSRAGRDMIPILEQFDKLSKSGQLDAFKSLHFDESQIAQAQALVGAFGLFERILEGIKNQVGAAFFSDLTRVFDALNKTLLSNVSEIKAWAASLEQSLRPAFDALVIVIQSFGQAKDKAFADDVSPETAKWITIFNAIITTVKVVGDGFELLAKIVTTAFKVATEVVRPFVPLINAIFGGDASAEAVVFALVLGKISGAFGLIYTAGKLVYSLFAGLESVFAKLAGTALAESLGLTLLKLNLIGAIVGLLIYDYEHWTEITNGLSAAFKGFLTLMDSFNAATTSDSVDFSNKWQLAAIAVRAALIVMFPEIEIISAIKRVLEWLGILQTKEAEVSKAAPAAPGSLDMNDFSGAGVGTAEGGPITGGTPGKDSVHILAMPGEFMVKRDSVNAVGVDFMHALNRLGDKPQGMAMGGLIGPVRMARGGAVVPAGASNGQGGTPVHIHMPSGRAYALIGPAATVTALAREATSRKMRSAGKKPSWDA